MTDDLHVAPAPVDEDTEFRRIGGPGGADRLMRLECVKIAAGELQRQTLPTPRLAELLHLSRYIARFVIDGDTPKLRETSVSAGD